MQGMVEQPKVVVGLDFGTSLSGFAYALRANPDMIYTFCDWPKQFEAGVTRVSPYCKTQTSLLYADACNGPEETLELREWGWPAYVQYKSSSVAESDDFKNDVASPNMLIPPNSGRSEAASVGSYFLSNFKHHLASKDSTTRAPALPRGLTAKRATADFLSQIAKLILQVMRNSFGPQISLDDVQWCLTVPANWDDTAKRKMRDCAEMAGLVQGPLSNGDMHTGSPHRLKLFVEPEAASVHCQRFMNFGSLCKGSKFLIVECGGGTVDFVLYEKLGSVPSLSVREVQGSSEVLCGGSRVEDELFQFMRRKICCFRRFESEHPATVLEFLKVWENIKYRFDGTNEVERVELDPKLVVMWEMEDEGSVVFNGELKLTNMKSMFDPIVTRILELIEEKMVPDLTAIMVVGGFSESPYHMKRIRDTFGSRVSYILSPPEPGSAVSRGSVTLGIRSDIIVSRISKKTYGVRVARPFIAGVHSECSKVEGDSGQFYCANIFGVFVKKGDKVGFGNCVQRVYFPSSETQDELEIVLYSSDCRNVKFISDVGSKKEGTFNVKIPTQEKLGFMPKVEVSMFFGGTEIQVTAVGKNFTGEKTGMLPVKFEASGIY